jgi:dipeptidyl-peptidase-4
VAGIDEKGKRVIFTAAQDGPENQEVWAVGFGGKGLKQLSPPGGYNDAEFSTGNQYFINTRSTATKRTGDDPARWPGQAGEAAEGQRATGHKPSRTRREPQQEFFQFTTEGGVALRGWMMKPADFDPGQRYPVLHDAVQRSQQQRGARQVRWVATTCGTRCSTQKGYIVVCVDPTRHGPSRQGLPPHHLRPTGQVRDRGPDRDGASGSANRAYVDGTRIGIFRAGATAGT